MAAHEQLALFDSAPALPRSPERGSGPPEPASRLPAPPRVAITLPPRLTCDCRMVDDETPLQPIGVMLRTSRHKTGGLTIEEDGLLVPSPAWARRKQLEEVIPAKAPWTLRKLRSLHE